MIDDGISHLNCIIFCNGDNFILSITIKIRNQGGHLMIRNIYTSAMIKKPSWLEIVIIF
jgi:hypothetical protein